MSHRTRVALALGSGGARGYAHVGAVQALEERGFEIAIIAGASMGALVGGLYAAGQLDGYTEWVLGLSQLDVLRLMDLSLSAPGVVRADKVFARVRDLIGDTLIEDLAIPFTAVATDLYARKEVWFQRGPLEVALRASIAIPGVFTPVMLNGRLLVDGGVMDPIPIGPTTSARADVTVAINLGGDPSGIQDAAPARDTAEERPVDEWLDRFRRGTAHLLDRDLFRSLQSRLGGGSAAAAVAATVGEELVVTPGDGMDTLTPMPAGLSKFDVMNQSLQALQSVLTRYCLAGNPPDVLVNIPRESCRTLDFHRAAEMIELGRNLTLEALDRAELSGLSP